MTPAPDTYDIPDDASEITLSPSGLLKIDHPDARAPFKDKQYAEPQFHQSGVMCQLVAPEQPHEQIIILVSEDDALVADLAPGLKWAGVELPDRPVAVPFLSFSDRIVVGLRDVPA